MARVGRQSPSDGRSERSRPAVTRAQHRHCSICSGFVTCFLFVVLCVCVCQCLPSDLPSASIGTPVSSVRVDHQRGMDTLPCKRTAGSLSRDVDEVGERVERVSRGLGVLCDGVAGFAVEAQAITKR